MSATVCVLASGYLVKRRHWIEKRENASFAQRAQDLIHARHGKLAKSANIVELLVVNSDPKLASFFLRRPREGSSMAKSSVGTDR